MPFSRISGGAAQTLWRYFGRRMPPVSDRAIATQAPNPLDMGLVGVPPMPRGWSQNAMKASLTPQQLAAIAGAAPEAERPAVGWTLLMIRSSGDFVSGKPVNIIVKLHDGQGVAYRFQARPDGTTTVRRVGLRREPVASAGFQAQAAPDALITAAKERWKPYGFKFEGPWQVGDLMKLHKVLLTLSPREIEHLRDLTFKRGGADPRRAGVYEAHGDEATITYFDGAFDHDDTTFVGEGQPYSERTLYHEIGHALLGWADRVLWRQLDDTIRQYNQVIERYNASSWSEQRKLEGELERAKARYEAAKARYSHGSDVAYVAERFKGRPSPTEYGETNASELQAEAYSVFKTEPERLAEFDADLFSYFSSGDYLRHWRKGPDGKWVPDAVPGDLPDEPARPPGAVPPDVPVPELPAAPGAAPPVVPAPVPSGVPGAGPRGVPAGEPGANPAGPGGAPLAVPPAAAAAMRRRPTSVR